MNSLIEKIGDLLSAGISVALIGPTNSGKTQLVTNELIPLLREKGKNVCYWTDSNHPVEIKDADIVIIDEAETLADQVHLEQVHSEEKPYYPKSYLARVKRWHELYRNIPQPSLYIITRNAEDVSHLVQTLATTDWDRPVTAIQWKLNH